MARRGLCGSFHIASAATSREETATRSTLLRFRSWPGTALRRGKYAVQLRASDYGEYDYLLAMEQYNIGNMMKILREDPEGKVRLLLDFTGHPGDIADPWYCGHFDQTYADICRAARDCWPLWAFDKDRNPLCQIERGLRSRPHSNIIFTYYQRCRRDFFINLPLHLYFAPLLFQTN